jgi:hypothetical protein
VKHAALAVAALAFWPIVGTTHSWVFTTLMLTAIWADWRRTRELP